MKPVRNKAYTTSGAIRPACVYAGRYSLTTQNPASRLLRSIKI